MSSFLGFLLAAAGLLLLAAVVYGAASAWRKAANDTAPLPLFGMIRRWGKTSQEPASAPDAEALALATRRCTYCGDKEQCRARLAADSAARPPPTCPNLSLFEDSRLPADRARQ